MRQLHYRVDGRVARNLSPTCMPFTRRRREDVHFPGNTLITGNAIRHTQGARSGYTASNLNRARAPISFKVHAKSQVGPAC